MNPVLYGGNMLFHRNNIGPDGNFDELVLDLGLTSLRYPGGSIAEELFDIRNPNATVGIDPRTGDAVPIEPLSDVAGFAAANNLTLTVVLPMRTYLSDEVDDLGHRLPAVDVDGLQTFVSDLVGGVYGNAKIAGLEIGNEYWGIGEFENGSMTTLEYARVASEVTRILDETLATLPGGEDVAILVQMGTNYNAADLAPDYADVPRGDALDDAVRADYDLPDDVNFLTAGGDMNWTRVANHIIIEQLSQAGVLDQVDGVIAHVYSRYPDAESSRHWQLDIIDTTWGVEAPGIDTWVTEWSRKASTDAFERATDYGLKSAAELVDMIGVFGDHKVDAAYYWTPQHNTVTALAGMTKVPDGQAPPLTAAGEIFRMMAENIQGLSTLDMAPNDPHTNDFTQDGIDVHVYLKPAQMTLYIVNNRDEAQGGSLDLSNYLDDAEDWQITILGVAPGDDPGDPNVPPVLTEVDPTGAVDGMVISQTLQPYEAMEVVITGANFSQDLTRDLVTARTEAGTSLEGLILDPEDSAGPPLLGNNGEDTGGDTGSDTGSDAGGDDAVPPPDTINDDPVIVLPDEDPPDTSPPEPEDDADDGGVMDMLMMIGLPLVVLLAFAA